MIGELAKEHSVSDLCQVLEVARSAYYRWCRGTPSRRAAANGQLAIQIKKIHQAKGGTYGSITGAGFTALWGTSLREIRLLACCNPAKSKCAQ